MIPQETLYAITWIWTGVCAAWALASWIDHYDRWYDFAIMAFVCAAAAVILRIFG